MDNKHDLKIEETNENIITLCHACARDYYNSPDFYIKAIYPRTVKESCTKCGKGGYDYIVKDTSEKQFR